MQVIPVIDLLGGLVVRGVGGRRDEYRPIQSILAADARGETVAQAFVSAGFCEAYVADLDAILGGPPAWKTYEQMADCRLRLWVDAGLSTVERASEVLRFDPRGERLSGIVAGLESLSGPEMLAEMLHKIPAERLVFSLDLKAGKPLVQPGAWHGLNAMQIATIALRLGVRRLIVLDLASVGMGQGAGTEPLVRSLRCLDTDLQIVGGGGVRGPADLRGLHRAGCDGALVASALHDGRLTARDWMCC